MLQYNDRSIKKLIEHLSCYQTALADSDVHGSFADILAKANKFASTDLKQAVAELESRIEEIHSKGLEDGDADEKAARASKKVAKARGKGKVAPASKVTRKALSAVDNAGRDDAEESAPVMKKSTKTGKDRGKGTENASKKAMAARKADIKKATSSRRRQVVDDDDDDEMI